MNFPKDLFGNSVITSFRQPPAALITPSQVKAKGYRRVITYHGIVHLDAVTQPSVSSPTLGFVEGAGLGIQQQAIMGRIELDIGGPLPDQFCYFVAENIHDIGEEAI